MNHGVNATSGEPLHLHGTLLPSGETKDLWIVDGMITFTPVAGARTICKDGWILPGLVDAHCHPGMARNELGEENPLSEVEIAAKMLANRDAGVLLVREPGSPSPVSFLHQREDLPRFIGMGRHIACPKRYLRDVADEVDPQDLTAAVERQAALGDGWIKLVGDWIDRSAGDLMPLFNFAQAKKGIARAHELGVKVTAHCFGEESVEILVEAGIDCIEHGTGMTPTVMKKMAEQNIPVVPTLINVENFPNFAAQGDAKFPKYSAHMRDLYARRYDTFKQALEMGVQIYAGTDAGGFVDHGRIAAEIAELAKIGGNEFAVGAASWRAREWLDYEGISEAAAADIVIFDADPYLDVAVMERPKMVILRGNVVVETN
ncbi:MAG: amidohydrolase family protein [Propionibacteriaceae bacterium]